MEATMAVPKTLISDSNIIRRVSFSDSPPVVFQTPIDDDSESTPKTLSHGKDIRPPSDHSLKHVFSGNHGESISAPLAEIIAEQDIITSRIDKVETKRFELDERMQLLEERLNLVERHAHTRKVSFNEKSIQKPPRT